MEDNITIGELTNKVEKASTDFEKTNTELKRKYLIWNIEAFNSIASAVTVSKGSFGTGYPFYALDKNLQGPLPIIQEQIRYNRQLVRDGEPFQKSIYLCKSCLKKNYETMPDLKTVCKPCPNMPNTLKPRKIVNKLSIIIQKRNNIFICCSSYFFSCVMQALFLVWTDIFQNRTYHGFHQALILACSFFCMALCDNTKPVFYEHIGI